MRKMSSPGFLVLALVSVTPGLTQGDPNPQYTLSIRGPCGQTIEGLPGSLLDDGTGGAPDFSLNRPGCVWDVVLTRTTLEPTAPSQTGGWYWAAGFEGSVSITDISLKGTLGCPRVEGPPCMANNDRFYNRTEMTGPPDGAGPQTEENRGAISIVIFGVDGDPQILKDGSWPIGKIRVTGEFPANEGEIAVGRVFFTQRRGTSPAVISSAVFHNWSEVKPTAGNPPLLLESCEIFLKAVLPTPFLRCDGNGDGRLEISDAVWVLRELFNEGDTTMCSEAADCDGDHERNITDPIFALSYLFLGGSQPSAPFPKCERLPGISLEDCPAGSTACQ